MAHLDGSLNQTPAGRLHVGVIERAQAACQQGYCRGDPSRQARVQRSLVTSDSGGVAAYRRILRQTLVQDLASSLRTRRTIEEPTAARQPARGDPLCTARRSGPGRGPAGDQVPGAAVGARKNVAGTSCPRSLGACRWHRPLWGPPVSPSADQPSWPEGKAALRLVLPGPPATSRPEVQPGFRSLCGSWFPSRCFP